MGNFDIIQVGLIFKLVIFMTDKEFFDIMSDRGYKTKKSISDAFDIPYTTVSKWGCSSTAPEYVKKLILSYSELMSVSSKLESDSESLVYTIKLSFEQIYLLLELIGTQTSRIDVSVFDNDEIEEFSKIAKLFRKLLFI